MIDYWLIFAQLIIFTEVVLLTIMESYREEEAASTRGAEMMVSVSAGLGEEDSAPVTAEEGHIGAWTQVTHWLHSL